MDRRLQLQSLLEEILGSENVYFQPPANVQMKFPCITYQHDRSETKFAGNNPYSYDKRYQVTYISRDPDDDVPDKLARLPLCTYDRFYAVNNLNHDVLTLFF